MRRTRIGFGTTVAIACITVAGCIGGTDTRPDTGASITVFGPYRGAEADRFADSVEEFTERTGVKIRYTGSADFVTDLGLRTGELNDPPDVAMVPQPGLVRDLADTGRILELSDEARAALAANYSSEAMALGDIDGTQFGVPFRANVKSLVWYRPSVFAARGWALPRSLDELEDLSARIQMGGEMAPWCLAIAAGTATGWPATDWTEDLVLRLDGADVYNGWANGDLPFSSPEVSEAFDRFRSLVLAPGRLDGGTTTAVETGIRRVFDPLFGDEPGCAMAKQADFALAWMPADTTVGPDGDVDFFVLPDVNASDGVPPLVVGGDVAVQFRRDPDVDAFVAFLAGEQAGEPWARQGGFLSPKSSFDPDVYPTSAQRRIAALLTTASTLAFDASDQMPASIGSALLWQDITLWVAGVADYEAMALDLDDAFAALDEATPLSSGTPP